MTSLTNERMEGVEPSAFAMATRRSSHLSYIRLELLDCFALSVDICQQSWE